MALPLPLPHHIVSTTWHNVRLTRGNFNFFKKLKKLKIKKKLKELKKIKKKKSKKPRADTWHIISTRYWTTNGKEMIATNFQK